jgi:hypothetical protein
MTTETADKINKRTICRYAIHVDAAEECDVIHTLTVAEVFGICGWAYESCPEYRLRCSGVNWDRRLRDAA